jgi:DMSO/TMAO reductase YedYZ molybdopterin-dependent catalytic subunit
VVQLPPGQRAVHGFPRFGVDLNRPPPHVPLGSTITVMGQLTQAVSFQPGDLADLPRREIVADFHCVAGWSAIGLRWEGVAFSDFYRLMVVPALAADAVVEYAVFVGADGYRSIVRLEDVLADHVLLADRLDGRQLSAEHGAPVRLVSPGQYGHVSTKHLCRIELYAAEPVGFYHPDRRIQRAQLVLRSHPRSRVWREERHRYVPSWLIRRIYRRLVKLPAPLLTSDKIGQPPT